ncbi:hypothetical protein B0H14DRAFT_3492486 [Mycena olivaceomarginata]|nr:hypothetical protein B0H14DRAFT_3492486 [Mycena olivaceomarginata]
MAPRYSPFASPHYAGFSAHVRHTFPQWVISPTAVTNDDLRPTHLPYAIHRQRACKTQYISEIAVLRKFWKRISFSIFFRSGTSDFSHDTMTTLLYVPPALSREVAADGYELTVSFLRRSYTSQNPPALDLFVSFALL